MAEPSVLISSAVAAIAVGLVLPGVIAHLVGASRTALRSSSRLRSFVAAAIAVILARPGPVEATTPPPVLRIPLPTAPAAGGDAASDPREPSVRSVVPVPGTYVVATGDCLWTIAERHLAAREKGTPSDAAIDRAWRRLYAENRDLIGDDPDLIFPGQTLTLPEEW